MRPTDPRAFVTSPISATLLDIAVAIVIVPAILHTFGGTARTQPRSRLSDADWLYEDRNPDAVNCRSGTLI